MKKNSPIFLYIIILLAILSGLALLIFKGDILEALRRQTGVDSAAEVSGISATVATVAAASALDTSILKLPRFTSLVNHVVDFNFDNICWRPDTITRQPTTIVKEVITDETAADAETGAVPANCVQGNSAPFSAKKK